MIEKFHFKWFKSIENMVFNPGRVNIFIGANGSGKSNLLEAIGVLAAAAYGRVDDEALLRRGVRPGVPALYKSSFPSDSRTPHIYFGAWRAGISYEVTLFNPIEDPKPAWRYHTESLKDDQGTIVGRSHSSLNNYNPEAGLVALKTVEMGPDEPSTQLINALRDFAIFSPETNVLRSIYPDMQQRQPLGMSGGRLPNAVQELLKMKKDSKYIKTICQDALDLIDWAKSYDTAPSSGKPLSQSIGTTQRVIRFTDRYMKEGRNTLTGYDASEGALYILFHMVLAGHPDSPSVCAVDNADHALNPRLARELFSRICKWYSASPTQRQIFLTTQNPLSLDGLPLQDDNVRLFSVSRTTKGQTVIKRIVLDEKMEQMKEQGWTLSRLWVMGHIGGVPDV